MVIDEEIGFLGNIHLTAKSRYDLKDMRKFI
jgi:hypothetical protein